VELLFKYDIYNTKKYISYIQISANQTYKLLENLLEWARLQTGRINIKPEYFDIKSVIENNIKLFETAALNKNIILKSTINDIINVYADPNTVDMVIRNLISNAIKFTISEGEIIIGINKLEDFAEIHVEDTGVGIEEKDIKKLFRIDEGFSTEGTNSETGTGLGLILCKEFVEKNGGKLNVISEIGKGSKFYFTVPYNSENTLGKIPGKVKDSSK